LDAPPEKVWRALEDQTLRERWLTPADVPADRGGPIDCQVIEADPPHRLRVAWSNPDSGLRSEVTFTVTPREGGSHLRIVHTGLGVTSHTLSSLKMAA
ncbi:MAG TPA: SRPBCC domain-containing protein, partial [Caulobacteraceae bacterium]|nr:SRPBCC domain-containing protein [Caulobacteraceae bacterium]